MQSETADVAPGDATWRSQPSYVVWRPTGAAWRIVRKTVTYVSSLVMAYSQLYIKTWHHPQYITYCIAVKGGPNHRIFGDNWTCWFWDTQADRQTNRQADIHRHADTLITILFTPTGSEVTISHKSDQLLIPLRVVTVVLVTFFIMFLLLLLLMRFKLSPVSQPREFRSSATVRVADEPHLSADSHWVLGRVKVNHRRCFITCVSSDVHTLVTGYARV